MGARSVAVLVVVFALGFVAPALAQPSPADQAIAKGQEAVALYEQGQWESALALFMEADALYHSPVLVLYAARSRRHLGRLLAARELYRNLANEHVDEGVPESWKKAQMDGAAELQAIEAEIPRVTVLVYGAAKPKLSIDDKDAPLWKRIEIDPGPHRFVLEAAGRAHKQAITVQRGERARQVVFDLRQPVHGESPNVPGIVLTSIGGAAVIAGAIMGGVALSRANSVELPASCVDSQCPPYEQAAVDQSFDPIRTLANVSDGFLFGGAVIAAVGVVLLVVNPGHEERPAIGWRF